MIKVLSISLSAILFFFAGPHLTAGAKTEVLLTKEQATELVKDHLDIKNNEEIVEYDHDYDGNYVIHVYSIIEHPRGGSHTATIGWYYVDFKSHEIRSMFDVDRGTRDLSLCL